MKITVYEFIKHEVYDKFTIIIDRQDKDFPIEMWSMSQGGSYAFSCDSRDIGYNVGRHLGKKVAFHNLDTSIQKSILKNLILIRE